MGPIAPGSRFATSIPTVPTAWIVFATRSVPIVAEGITVAAGNACYAGVLVAAAATMVGEQWTGPLLALPLLLAAGAALLWRHDARSR